MIKFKSRLRRLSFRTALLMLSCVSDTYIVLPVQSAEVVSIPSVKTLDSISDLLQEQLSSLDVILIDVDDLVRHFQTRRADIKPLLKQLAQLEAKGCSLAGVTSENWNDIFHMEYSLSYLGLDFKNFLKRFPSIDYQDDINSVRGVFSRKTFDDNRNDFTLKDITFKIYKTFKKCIPDLSRIFYVGTDLKDTEELHELMMPNLNKSQIISSFYVWPCVPPRQASNLFIYREGLSGKEVLLGLREDYHFGEWTLLGNFAEIEGAPLDAALKNVWNDSRSMLSFSTQDIASAPFCEVTIPKHLKEPTTLCTVYFVNVKNDLDLSILQYPTSSSTMIDFKWFPVADLLTKIDYRVTDYGIIMGQMSRCPTRGFKAVYTMAAASGEVLDYIMHRSFAHLLQDEKVKVALQQNLEPVWPLGWNPISVKLTAEFSYPPVMKDPESSALPVASKLPAYTPSLGHLRVELGDDYVEVRDSKEAFLQNVERIMKKFKKAYAEGKNPGLWSHFTHYEHQSENYHQHLAKILSSETDKYYNYQGCSAGTGFICDATSSLRLTFEKGQGIVRRENAQFQQYFFRGFDDGFDGAIDPSLAKFVDSIEGTTDGFFESFNYRYAYTSRAICANLFLFGNYDHFGSSSLAYAFASRGEDEPSHEYLLRMALLKLGFPENRVDHYLESYLLLFKKYYGASSDANSEIIDRRTKGGIVYKSRPGCLYQIAFDKSKIDEIDYLSEIAGYPLLLPPSDGSSSELSHHISSVLPLLLEDPIAFEAYLEKNADQFKQQEGRDLKDDERKTNLLEARGYQDSRLWDPSKIEVTKHNLTFWDKNCQYTEEQYYSELNAISTKMVQEFFDKAYAWSVYLFHRLPMSSKLLNSTKGNSIAISNQRSVNLYQAIKRGNRSDVFQYLDYYRDTPFYQENLELAVGLAREALMIGLYRDLLVQGYNDLKEDKISLTSKWVKYTMGYTDDRFIHQLLEILSELPQQRRIIEQESLLHWLIAKNKGDLVEKVLGLGIEVDHLGTEKRISPLMMALQYGRSSLAKMLMERKADVNQVNKEGVTPLYYAIVYGTIEEISLLLSHGADPHYVNNINNTPFLRACELDKQHIIKRLLDEKPDVNQVNDLGYAPLSCALLHDNKELTVTLLERDADLLEALRHYREKSPLLKFAKKKEYDFLKLLIEYAREKGSQYTSELLGFRDSDGMTLIDKLLEEPSPMGQFGMPDMSTSTSMDENEDISSSEEDADVPEEEETTKESSASTEEEEAIEKDSSGSTEEEGAIEKNSDYSSSDEEEEENSTKAFDVSKETTSSSGDDSSDDIFEEFDGKFGHSDEAQPDEKAIEFSLYLIDNGAIDLEISNLDGGYPTTLMTVAHRGCLPVIEAILHRVKLVSPDQYDAYVNYHFEKVTALHLSLECGSEKTCLHLLENGARIDEKDAKKWAEQLISRKWFESLKIVLNQMVQIAPNIAEEYSSYR